MAVIRVAKRTQYTVIDQSTVRDDRLSFKALGLLTYLLSFPDNWKFNTAHLSNNRKEGRDSIKAALAELVAFGYAERVIQRNDDGTLAGTSYEIYERPRDVKPVPRHEDNRATENPVFGSSVKTSAKPNKNKRSTERRVSRQSENPQLTNTDKKPNTKEPITESASKKQKPKPEPFSPDSWQYVFSRTFYERLIAQGKVDPPAMSESAIQKGADVFDRITRIGRLDPKPTPEEIAREMRWLLDPDGWWMIRSAIRSPAKLMHNDTKNSCTYYETIRNQYRADLREQQIGHASRNGRVRHGSVEEEIAKAMAP